MQMTQCLLVCSSRLLSEETAAAGFLQVCLGLDRLSSVRASPHSQAFHVAVASTGHLPMGIPACLQSGQLMLPLPEKQQFQGLSRNDTCKKLVIPGTSLPEGWLDLEALGYEGRGLHICRGVVAALPKEPAWQGWAHEAGA